MTEEKIGKIDIAIETGDESSFTPDLLIEKWDELNLKYGDMVLYTEPKEGEVDSIKKINPCDYCKHAEHFEEKD